MSCITGGREPPMRLFMAIRFQPEIEERFARIVDELRTGAVSGNFTRRENLHLTVVFLGETARRDAAQEALENLEMPMFELVFETIGRFRRDEGDIYWVGARQSDELYKLHHNLAVSLRARGFQLDNRPYRPHLTLGRRVVTTADFDREALSDRVGKMSVLVDSVTLMHSHRVDGHLTYSPLYKHLLKGK